jgi:transposase-like protein
MGKSRKQYSSQFKAKVAIEAIKGHKTTAELASQYELHPTVINGWKRQLQENAENLFENNPNHTAKEDKTEATIDELYRQIGQLKVERDFLVKSSAKLGLRLESPW